MDNFRKFAPNRSKSSAIDGFLPNHSKQPTNGKPVVAPPRPTIGDFKRPDGFHTVDKGTIGFPAKSSDTLGRQPSRDPHGQIELGKPLVKTTRKNHKRNWRLKVKRGALSLSMLALFGSSYLGYQLFMKGRQILAGGGGAAALQENVDPALLNVEGDGRINILLLGKGGDGHTAPDLTDTIMIASIDPIHKEAALVSIPRDFYVKNETGSSMKINAVYATAKSKVLSGKKQPNQTQKAERAGFDAVEKTLETALGLPIHYNVMVDFDGFKKAIDAVGGIDMDVKTSLYEIMRIDGKRYVLDVKTGVQHFDGFRALAYSRSRNTARGDFDRAERQRSVLIGLRSKVFTLGTLSNPVKINELLNAFGDHVQTNFVINEMTRLYEIGNEIDGSKVESIGLADPPNDFLITRNIGGQSVVVPKAGTYNYKDLQNYLRNKLRDGFLRQEDASIAVYNGTSTAGLATRTGDDLKSYGYNITTVADAPTKGNKETILVDLRNGQKKYTKHYLERRLKVTARTSLPDGITINPGTADFVIILGTNEVARLGT